MIQIPKSKSTYCMDEIKSLDDDSAVSNYCNNGYYLGDDDSGDLMSWTLKDVAQQRPEQ